MKRTLSLALLVLGLSTGCAETPSERRYKMFRDRKGLPEWTLHHEHWDHYEKETMAVYSGICFNGRYSDDKHSLDRALVSEEEAEYLLKLYGWKKDKIISIASLPDYKD